jgi:Rrf2 family iron-sulfur cluster assembly transcriptional regulator
LASRPRGELTPVQDIADATKLPKAYLSKVIQRLAQEGLVRTFRGPGGGIELREPPEAITLWTLVHATEGPGEPDRCALGIGDCSSKDPCPLHERWAPLRDEFQKLLEGTTLTELLRGISEIQSDKQPTARSAVRKRDGTPLPEITSEGQGRP